MTPIEREAPFERRNKKIVVGEKYGRLTTIQKAGHSNDHHLLWECRCDCGNITLVQSNNLGKSTFSCGCFARDRSRQTNSRFDDDVIGEKFGRLTVLGISEERASGHIVLKCMCDCGNVTHVHASHIGKSSRSCGCLGRETTILRNTRHEESRRGNQSRLYRAWAGMLKRCKNTNDKSFKDYGMRGISVCHEWESFECFREWAIKSGYVDGLSIERVDVNADYNPQNCTWIPIKRQARNKRCSIKYRGIPLIEVCQNRGLNYNTIRGRVQRGWDVEFAVLAPPNSSKRRRSASL